MKLILSSHGLADKSGAVEYPGLEYIQGVSPFYSVTVESSTTFLSLYQYTIEDFFGR